MWVRVSGFLVRGTAMPSDFLSLLSGDLDLNSTRSLYSKGMSLMYKFLLRCGACVCVELINWTCAFSQLFSGQSPRCYSLSLICPSSHASLWGVNFSICLQTCPCWHSTSCLEFVSWRQVKQFFFVLCKNWSPQQLHAHQSDQFTFPLPAEKQCCLFSVGCLNRPSPLRHHTCTTDPERGTTVLVNTHCHSHQYESQPLGRTELKV